MKTGSRKKESQLFYQIHLPGEFLKNRIDLFKITFQPEKNDIMIERQWVTPDAALLEIEKGNETYLLLANRQKAAALALKNIPASASEQGENPVKLTAEEKVKAVAAINERQKTLIALQAEVKLIPVEYFSDSGSGKRKCRRTPQPGENCDRRPGFPNRQGYWPLRPFPIPATAGQQSVHFEQIGSVSLRTDPDRQNLLL